MRNPKLKKSFSTPTSNGMMDDAYLFMGKEENGEIGWEIEIEWWKIDEIKVGEEDGDRVERRRWVGWWWLGYF